MPNQENELEQGQNTDREKFGESGEETPTEGHGPSFYAPDQNSGQEEQSKTEQDQSNQPDAMWDQEDDM